MAVAGNVLARLLGFLLDDDGRAGFQWCWQRGAFARKIAVEGWAGKEWMKMADKELDSKLKSEIASFQAIWDGGYYEGDPLDPMGASNYGLLGYMSVLHAVYLACIRQYVNENSVVLEIGPGRGAWTKTFLKAKEIWCLDALSAEHNGFWEQVGNAKNIKYFQVKDFSCDVLPEARFNYLFSFGVFCHISFAGITEYMKNLRGKMASGAHCFIMIADYEKYNAAIADFDRLSLDRGLCQGSSRRRLAGRMYKVYRHVKPVNKHNFLSLDEEDVPRPERWYNAGIQRTCEMLQQLGYEVLERDMCLLHRDPIIHFIKP